MSDRGAQWYKREPRAFLEGIRRLSEREIAVYAVVLDLIYDSGHETYDDPKHIASYFSDLGAAAVRRAIDGLVEAGKLIRENGRLTNKRAKNEGKTRKELAETRRNSGRLGGVSSGKSRRQSNENSGLAEANISPVSSVDKIREEKEDIEPKGSLSETSSDELSKTKNRIAYPGQFEAFWKAFPTSPNMSKSKALAGWKKLDEADRLACSAAVPGYRAFLKSKTDHPTMHATTFINERRFEGFAAKAAPGVLTDEDWEKRLRYGRHQKAWWIKWGPAPGAAGCLVPQHLLQPEDSANWRPMEEGA